MNVTGTGGTKGKLCGLSAESKDRPLVYFFFFIRLVWLKVVENNLRTLAYSLLSTQYCFLGGHNPDSFLLILNSYHLAWISG